MEEEPAAMQHAALPAAGGPRQGAADPPSLSNPFFMDDESDDDQLLMDAGDAGASSSSWAPGQPSRGYAPVRTSSDNSLSSGGSAPHGVRQAAPEPSQPNPFSNLTDIARSQNFDAENDNLALFEPEIKKRPKVAQILSNLVRYNLAAGEQPDEMEYTAEKSMVALKRKSPVKMGTLLGVYLPTLQTILGVIFFLRFAWIIGVAGVGESLLIVMVCCTTTMLTAISMSAIATNGVVPAGGAYFMISRALGPEFGGAVGILFYLGTTFASSMYILGAIEILLTYIAPSMSLFGEVVAGSNEMLNNLRVYGTVLLSAMALIVFIGVKYVNRFASVCLVLVLTSIFSVYLGYFASPTTRQPHVCLVDGLLVKESYAGNCTASDFTSFPWQTNMSTYERVRGIPGASNQVLSSNFGPNFLLEGDAAPGVRANPDLVAADITSSFTLLLAIFFPSVTGIMAGSNRSGDLKDASRSIPTGTIAAIMTTSLVYVTSVLFIGAAVEGPLLRDKFGDSIGGELLMAEIAWPHPSIILLGALMSCIGAGLQSLMGAPRLLQAIAADNLLPFLHFFAKPSASGEPTRALILTACIAEIGVLIASLDSVAPIITMFFLMCYGFVNLACSLQSLLKSPSWRPRFQYYHWGLSALGLALCLILMFISSWVYALLALILAGMIYHYIEFKGAAKEWGDGIRGLSMQAARYSLLRLEDTPPHTKNWRPQMLLLCKLDPTSMEVAEPRLFDVAEWLKGGKGLTMTCSVLDGTYEARLNDIHRGQHAIKMTMKRHSVQGFNQVIASRDITEGLSYVIQGSGLGALRHNTVLVGWPEAWQNKQESSEPFLKVLRSAAAGQLAVLVPKNLEKFPTKNIAVGSTIDVWWVVHDGGMLILLAFLLQQDPMWRRCKLRIFTIAENDDNSIQMERDLKLFLYHLRIDAEVSVIEMLDSDVSAYTYERTLKMEKRQELYARLKLNRAHGKKKGPRDVEQAVNQSRAAHKRQQPTAHPSAGHGVPEQENLRMMNTSVKLNGIIRQNSKDAQMIFLNLPGVPAETEAPTAGHNYLEFIEVLTEGLRHVIMIRGGGREVITIFS